MNRSFLLRFFQPTLPKTIFALLLMVTPVLRADVRLPKLFSDHMVLQRDMKIAVWGWAQPGENVTVEFDGESVSLPADGTGNWKALLAPRKANTTPKELTVTGKNTITISDVLVGDVWLCSGQSNMAFPLGECDAKEDAKSADLPGIRYIPYWENFSGQPQEDANLGQWQPVTPDSAPGCTAVGFYFGRRIHKETGVPIGLLLSSVGGTEIECWLPPEAFRDYPACVPAGKALEEAVIRYRQALLAALPELENWLKPARQALAAGKPVPPMPPVPLHPNEDRGNWVRAQSLYNGMIHPLTPFPIKGAIWYQGENNGTEEDSYFEKKRALMETWRKRWGYEFPFYFVQLTNFLQPTEDPSGGAPGWQSCRMAQLNCLKLPKTGMAVSIDVGDAVDIHPKNKFDVGERLALWALAKDYNKTNLVCSGPLLREAKIEGNKLRVYFDSVGSGLMVGRKIGRAHAVEDSSARLKHFAIAGSDQKWFWAEAAIEGDTVVVSSPSVPNPVAVRYAFAMNPSGCNLYNKEGLPASPFRTDNW